MDWYVEPKKNIKGRRDKWIHASLFFDSKNNQSLKVINAKTQKDISHKFHITKESNAEIEMNLFI